VSGPAALNGGLVVMEDTEITDWGMVGVYALGGGAEVRMTRCTVDTPEWGVVLDADSTARLTDTLVAGGTIGLAAQNGGTGLVESSRFEDQEHQAIVSFGEGSHLELQGVEVGPGEGEDVMAAVGVIAGGGGVVDAEGLRVRNTGRAGVAADGEGSEVHLEDADIDGVQRLPQDVFASGVVAQVGGGIFATEVTVQRIEGDGLVATRGSLSCTACSIEGASRAGAVTNGGELELRQTTIRGTNEDANTGGGVGLLANPSSVDPTRQTRVLLVDTHLEDNHLGALYLDGPGSYQVMDSTLAGPAAPPAEAMLAPYAVLARDGIERWDEDEQTGLLLDGVTIEAAGAVGALLDASSATFVDTTWNGGDPDVVTQACGEEDPSPEGLDQTGEAEICPTYDRLYEHIVLDTLLVE